LNKVTHPDDVSMCPRNFGKPQKEK
jgi:hypothetical protein